MWFARIAALALVLGGTAAQAFVRAQPVRSAEVDVSNLPGPQTNATITVDPNDPDVLLAGRTASSRGRSGSTARPTAALTWKSSITITPPATSRRLPLRPRRRHRPHGPAVLLVRPRDAVQRAGLVAASTCSTRAGPDGGMVAADPGRASSGRALRRQAGDRGRRVALRARTGTVSTSPGRASRATRAPASCSATPTTAARPGRRRSRVSAHGRERRHLRVTLAVARNGTVYVAWTDETNYSVRDRPVDGRRQALRPATAGGRVLDHPDPALRHRHRRRGRAALVHPGRPDRRSSTRPAGAKRAASTSPTRARTSRGRGRVALDLRQPAASPSPAIR